MKFNLKQLLTSAVFFGYVNCTPSDIGKDGLIKKIEESKDKIEKFGENTMCKSMIIALKNPNCFIAANYSFDDKCVDKNADDFYRIIFTGDNNDKQLETFSAYCKTHENLDDLETSIAASVKSAYDSKKKFLTEIVYKIPIVSEYKNATSDFDLIIKSHIDKFITDSLVYDGTRLTFSNLHKTVERIKNAFKVERKASDGVEAALAMLKGPEASLTKLQPGVAFSIYKESDDANADRIKPKNIINVAINASDKSTSSPMILGFILVGSLLISMILLLFKAYTAGEAKDEDEAEGKHWIKTQVDSA